MYLICVNKCSYIKSLHNHSYRFLEREILYGSYQLVLGYITNIYFSVRRQIKESAKELIISWLSADSLTHLATH